MFRLIFIIGCVLNHKAKYTSNICNSKKIFRKILYIQNIPDCICLPVICNFIIFLHVGSGAHPY